MSRITYVVPETIYFWEQLEVKETKHAGLGLFAAEDIAKNTAFPYYGLEKKKDPENLHTVGINSKLFLDGDPKHEPDAFGVGGRGKFIMAIANEPRKGEVANCIMKIATTPNKVTDCRVHIITARDIKKGEELTWHYGSANEYHRDYEYGEAYRPVHHASRPVPHVKARGRTRPERRIGV